MKCTVCESKEFTDDDECEFVCNNCGAAFCLALLGYYPEGSNERLECGPEFEKWRKEYKKVEKCQS